MEIKSVLVTGAAGYMGRHVVRSFLDAGYQVLVNDLSYKGVDDRAIRKEADIFSGEKDIYQQMGEPDLLVHLAWRDGFVHNSDAHMKDLSDHTAFLQHMVDGGVKAVSVMGSMHEIGYWEGAIDETTPCNPQSMYGVAKNALRQFLLLYTKDKNVAVHWLRAYYIYGDDARGSSIFAKIVQAVEDGKTTFPFTSGKNQYDFIHIDQLAQQIVQASVQDQVNGIINVCSGEPISLGDKVESFIKEHQFEIKLDYGAFPDRPYDSPGVWGDPEKIQQIMKG
ncbi:MAG: NAD(P)-dependent oxidoreductase [Lachnospiraceae bacterium]|nr:NAD(P)-dependent oxidoreductase [Lachnospiraceae bacterium]